MPTLRDYQIEKVDELRACIRAGRRRLILQGQTGSGKSVVAAYIIKCCYDQGRTATIWAHTREIVNQLDQHLWDWGVNHVTIMSGEEYGAPANVTLCSKDTLLSRSLRRKILQMPPADLVVVDEAHRSLGRGYQRLLDHYKNAVILGLTATPVNRHGKCLAPFYQDIVQIRKPSLLIAEGHLVPTKCYAPQRPDMREVPIVGNDYDLAELEKRMDKPKITGDVIRHWQRWGEGRQTLVFASGIRHSIHLRDRFEHHGIRAEHFDHSASETERTAIIARFKSKETTVLCNFGMLCEGFDFPECGCVCMVRPTQSFIVFSQCCGRVQRPHEGKQYAILIDHAGVLYNFGFPDQDIDWRLSAGETIMQRVTKNLQDPKASRPICCPECFTVFSGTNICPNCNHVVQRQGRQAVSEQGQLIEVHKKSAMPVAQMTLADKQRIWQRFLAITARTGKTLAAAAAMYRARIGESPWQTGGLSPMPPSGQAVWATRTIALYPTYATGGRRPAEG